MSNHTPNGKRYVGGLLLGLLAAARLTAQTPSDGNIPLRNWEAPLYWQPIQTGERDAADQQDALFHSGSRSSFNWTFVGMKPCRVVDTRLTATSLGTLGPPSLLANMARTLPIPSSSLCSIPPKARAYSFRIAGVPSRSGGSLKIYPTGQPMPADTITTSSTIVPGGTDGAVDITPPTQRMSSSTLTGTMFRRETPAIRYGQSPDRIFFTRPGTWASGRRRPDRIWR